MALIPDSSGNLYYEDRGGSGVNVNTKVPWWAGRTTATHRVKPVVDTQPRTQTVASNAYDPTLSSVLPGGPQQPGLATYSPQISQPQQPGLDTYSSPAIQPQQPGLATYYNPPVQQPGLATYDTPSSTTQPQQPGLADKPPVTTTPQQPGLATYDTPATTPQQPGLATYDTPPPVAQQPGLATYDTPPPVQQPGLATYDSPPPVANVGDQSLRLDQAVATNQPQQPGLATYDTPPPVVQQPGLATYDTDVPPIATNVGDQSLRLDQDTPSPQQPGLEPYIEPPTASVGDQSLRLDQGPITTNVGDQSLRLDQGPIRMDVGDTTVNVNEAGATQGQQDLDAARARHADTYFAHLGNRLDADLTNEFDRTRYANTPELEMDPILDYTQRLREPVIKQAEENVGTPGFEFNELDTGSGTVLGNLQDQYRAGGQADLGSAALTADPNNLRTALESNVNRIGQANPYDTRRDDIIGGQDAQVDRMFDEEFARIENAFAVNNNLGSPAYIKAMQDMNARKAEAKLGIRSEFGQAAAAQDESMARGRIEDIEGAIASRRAGEMGEEQIQDLRRQGALGAGSYIGTEQFEQGLRGQGMEEAARRSRLQDAGQVLGAEQDQVMRDMLYQQQLQEQANQAYYRNLKAEEDAMYRPYQYQDAGLAMAMGAMGAPVDIGAAVGAYGSAGQYGGNAAEQAELWRALMDDM
jgi:hypothetical protein